jgi:hypothetical protein
MLTSPNFKSYTGTEALPIDEEMKLFVSAMLSKAESIMAESELIPVFFVRTTGGLGSFIPGEPKIAIIMSEFKGETREQVDETKDAFADKVRAFAQKEKANALLMLTEAYTLPPEYLQEYWANPDKYPMGLRDHPHRREVLSICLEIPNRLFMATAYIKNRKIEEVLWGEPPYADIEGRFVKLLPKQPEPPAHAH